MRNGGPRPQTIPPGGDLARLIKISILLSVSVYLVISAKIWVTLIDLDRNGVGRRLATLTNMIRGCDQPGNNDKSKRTEVRPIPRTFEEKSHNLPQCTPMTTSDVDITLTVQLDEERLWVMKHHCLAWKRQISLAVLSDRMKSSISNDLKSMGCRGNIILSTLEASKYKRDEYPVNLLRNIAIQASTTSHIVFVDADFFMPKGTDEVLMARTIKEKLARDAKQALVLPAFQLNYKCSDTTSADQCRSQKLEAMPQNIIDLHRGLDDGSVSMFDPKNPHGHDSTGYNKWRKQSASSVEDISCINSERYEPYLVVRRCEDMPPFPEAFAGYGWNKIALFLHLNRIAYKFARVGGAYLVHFPHGHSAARKSWDKDNNDSKTRNRKIFKSFKMWLSTQPDQGVPRCPFDIKFQNYIADTYGAPTCTPVPADSISYTMVTQLSTNRMWLMERQCSVWKGPMSLGIFTDRNMTSLQDELEKLGCDVDRIAIERVRRDAYKSEDYPVNILRNLALSNVKTSHFFYTDIDFMLSRDVESSLSSPEALAILSKDPKQTIVVPAFMANAHCSDDYKDCIRPKASEIPSTKPELLRGMLKGDVKVFDVETNPGGHGSTRYDVWMEQGPNTIATIPCLSSDRYEPYVAAQYCHEMPPFQESFQGYSSDKLQWIMHLHRRGYKLSQIGGAFVIHYPHKLDEWKKKKTLMSDVRQERFETIFGSFKSFLKGLPNEESVPFCSVS